MFLYIIILKNVVNIRKFQWKIYLKKKLLKYLLIINFLISELCVWCKRLKLLIIKKLKRLSVGKPIRVPLTPSKRRKFRKILNSKKMIRQKCLRAHKKIENLKQQLDNIKIQMKNIKTSTLNEIIQKSNLTECQSNLVHEIFNASKVKCKNQMRYSDNWMLLCLILQIR